MCMALRQKYNADVLEQEKRMDICQSRSVNQRKSPEESVKDYALRFRDQIIKVQPQEISDQALIHLFWDRLSEGDRLFSEYQAPWTDIQHFICSVLYAVNDSELVQPGPGAMEHNGKEFKEDEVSEEDIFNGED